MSPPATVTRLRSGLIAAFLGLAMALTSISPASAAEDEIDIPDAGFRACLSTVLQGRPLTADNLASLDRISVTCNETPLIQNLTGAEHLTNLWSLNVNSNAITDISPLAAASSLRSLQLAGNPVASLEPLAGLDQLFSLNVVGVATADLSAIKRLPGLRSLQLGGARPLADFDFLSQMEHVTYLSFRDVGLASLAEIALPPNLVTLTLETPALESLAGVERLTALARLGAANSHLTDLSPLASLTQLTHLRIPENDIADLGPLQGLTSLTSLDLDRNHIRDLRPLRNLTNLTSLGLGVNLVSDLSPLAGLAKLERLQLYNNEVEDITPLTGLTKITHLWLAWNQISDISPLADLPDGTDLVLSSNRVRDFSPLKNWNGTLSARSQFFVVSEVLPNAKAGVEVRGPDGSHLTPAKDPGTPCAYAEGALTCTRGGNHYLHFAVGDRISIILNAVVEHRLLTAATPPSTGRTAVKAGTSLTVQPGTWSPQPERFTFQWVRNDGSPIPGATSQSYRTTGAEEGGVWAEVTGHLGGYEATTVPSSFVVVTTGGQIGVATPTIRFSGRLATGTVLSTKQDVFDPAITHKYQWQRDKKNIVGATSASYKVRASDVGHKLRVRVTASREGYDSSTMHSVQVTPAKAKFAASAKPKISGTRAVGKKLTATVDWKPTAKLKYQWYRNGKKIKGATKVSYTLKASDLNDRFSVRVTAGKSGYTAVTKTSSKTAKVKKGTLVLGTPSISDAATVGKKLTASSSGWGPGKVSLSYRWYRDGRAIKGATSRSYQVKKSDAGHKLTVRVTGKKTGYTTKTVKSAAVAASVP